MTNTEKEALKKDRLAEYERRIFFLEMDVVAAKAVGDIEYVDQVNKEIDKLKTAYAAVEAM